MTFSFIYLFICRILTKLSSNFREYVVEYSLLNKFIYYYYLDLCEFRFSFFSPFRFFQKTSYLLCSQIWLNHLMDDRHFSHITELGNKKKKKKNPASFNYSLGLVFVFSLIRFCFFFIFLKIKNCPERKNTGLGFFFFSFFFVSKNLTKFMREN